MVYFVVTNSLPPKRMPTKRQFCHGVVVADEANGLGVADLIDDVDAATGILQAKAMTSQNVLIALRMKLCETLAELKLLTVNHDGTIGALLAFYHSSCRGFSAAA